MDASDRVTDAEDQAHLYVGHLTVPRDHPDYTALEAVAVVLGSGDPINQALSAAHACLYGVVHAVIVALGAAPG